MPVKKNDVTSRTWESLQKLKEHFVRTGDEEVVKYTGAELITKKYRYALAFGQLSRKKK